MQAIVQVIRSISRVMGHIMVPDDETARRMAERYTRNYHYF